MEVMYDMELFQIEGEENTTLKRDQMYRLKGFYDEWEEAEDDDTE